MKAKKPKKRDGAPTKLLAMERPNYDIDAFSKLDFVSLFELIKADPYFLTMKLNLNDFVGIDGKQSPSALIAKCIDFMKSNTKYVAPMNCKKPSEADVLSAIRSALKSNGRLRVWEVDNLRWLWNSVVNERDGMDVAELFRDAKRDLKRADLPDILPWIANDNQLALTPEINGIDVIGHTEFFFELLLWYNSIRTGTAIVPALRTVKTQSANVRELRGSIHCVAIIVHKFADDGRLFVTSYDLNGFAVGSVLNS